MCLPLAAEWSHNLANVAEKSLDGASFSSIKTLLSASMTSVVMQ
jgi:hypothetical protein